MTPTRLPSRLALAILGAALPLAAQTPLFTDGTAFGGSRVFSEGRNPLGNSACYGQAPSGVYFSYLDGSQRAKDNRTLLQDAANRVPGALDKLADAPWAQKTRAYGIVMVEEAAQASFTREEVNGLTAFPDLDPTRLGSATNGTNVLGRRTTVDRLSFGSSTVRSGTSYGGSLRIEQWRQGTQTAALNPVAGQASMLGLDDSLLASSTTQTKTLTYALDLGLTMEVAQGLQLGLMVDQLNGKHLWDVYLQPQFRAGLKLDLGPQTSLALESDLNSAARMPFPEKQQASSASLRFAVSPAVALLLGAERRKIGETSTTRGGVTLQLHTGSFLVGLGLQLGQDRPLRGATLMVN